MIKSACVFIAAAACAAGCTPTYRVHVNTYSDLAEPLSQASPIYIAADANAPNPILRKQMASKVCNLLRGNGYNPVEKEADAAYLLTFEAGIDSHRVMDYAPVYAPVGGYYYGRPGRHFGWGFGYTTYVPYEDMVYTHWLKIRLYARDTGQQTYSKMVWMGEGSLGTDNPELREALNYLLVACLEYFGADTREWVTVAITEDDPRITGIAAE